MMTPIILRMAVLIAVFAAIFLLSETGLRLLHNYRRGSAAINKRMQMIESGLDRDTVALRLRKSQGDKLGRLPGLLGKIGGYFEREVIASGVAMPVHQIVALMMGAAAASAALIIFGAVFSGYAVTIGLLQLGLLLGAAIGIGIPMLVVARLAGRRRKLVQEQFPVALDVFIRGLRAGHPIASALELLTTEMEDPIGSEFGMVVDSISYGANLRDALQSMADRWDNDDIQMFVVSLSVQSETGGNLAEVLTNLASVIRERASIYMKVRALSSEGRMTAILLTGLPVLSLVGLFAFNPSFYLDVSQDPIFIIGFTGLILLYAIGFFTIRRMVDLKV